ncbi:hypothetical protein CCACVL1_09386 [Corchorus capsularis]|uniref:Uncharacterized protein n=1 Tax=Corchorus capsularis TaxID=210143 RepID=A0A1R3IWL2_COCAP|nr:hypothetical protein CCACVL1_09386 [Corchorus capsularis]
MSSPLFPSRRRHLSPHVDITVESRVFPFPSRPSPPSFIF